MSLDTPSTKEISDNIIAQIEASINQTVQLLPKSFIRVLSKVLAGVFILLYKYCGFIFLQLFIKTASYSDTTINGKILNPLLEWGRLVGVSDPKSATNAELLIEIQVDNQIGSIDSQSQLIGKINGVTYLTLGSVLLNSSTVQVTIKAVADQQNGGGLGIIGNLNNGDIVSFVNPLANIQRDAIVISQVVTGANAENIENYRQRVMDRWQKPPRGGAYSDYELWGEETEGIINVYPYTSDCPGQVDVYVEATPESSGNEDGFPTLAQLQAVLDSINYDSNGLASRRPANCLVNTFSITRVQFDIRVVGLVVENVSEVRESIESSLLEYFKSREPFIEGLSIPPRDDRITRVSISGIINDIVNANNGYFGNAFISISGIDTALYNLEIGEKAKLGTVTFL
jgi:uncharacterized phage protein gp47/JayE